MLLAVWLIIADLFSWQMADSGGLPQLTQVTHHAISWGFKTSHRPVNIALVISSNETDAFSCSPPSWLKPSSISCREWATVSVRADVLSRMWFNDVCFWSFLVQLFQQDYSCWIYWAMYFLQRDGTCVNLALCFPCPVLSVAYVKDRRLSGGPGTSSSPIRL